MSDFAIEFDLCPATREAVIEREELGEIGCPICGGSAEEHELEDMEPATAGDSEVKP